MSGSHGGGSSWGSPGRGWAALSARSVGMGLSVLLLAGVLVAAPAALRMPGSAAGAEAPTRLTSICGGLGTVHYEWTGESDGVPASYGSVWVPPGGKVTVVAEGVVTGGQYIGGYKTNDNPKVEIRNGDDTQALAGDLTTLGPVGDGTAGPFPWGGVAASWTNPLPDAGARFLIKTWSDLDGGQLAAANRWDVEVTVTPAGSSTPLADCADEVWVPNAGVPGACGASPSAADPVGTVHGNFWQSWTDLAIAGRGPGLVWARSYNSAEAAVDGPLGFGWRSGYFMELVEEPGVVTIIQENGARLRFYDGGSDWVAAPRVDATLEQLDASTFELTRSGNEVFRFEDGRLVEISDLSGNSTTLIYSGGLLSSVTGPGGRPLSVTWSGGRVVKVEGPSAVLAEGGSAVPVEVAYGYDGAGDLVSVTDSAGGVWTFGYDGAHRVVSVREPRHDPLGAGAPVVENHYDAQGRVDWQDDRADRRTTFGYGQVPDTNVDTTTVTDPAGKAMVYEHTNGVCTGIVADPGPEESRWSYWVNDALGRTRTVGPDGAVVTASFDERGRRISVTDEKGTSAVTYTAEGQLATATDAAGVTTTYSYDAGTDRLRSVSTPITPGGGARVLAFDYTDPANPGLPTAITDERGKTTAFTYSTVGDVVSATDPVGETTTTTYNGLGWPLVSVAPAGNAPGGVPGDQATSWRYNPRGEVLEVTDPAGETVEYDRDGSGNVTARRDPTVSGVEETSFVLNAAGEVVTIDRPDASTMGNEYWPDGALKTQIDAAGAETGYTYDTQGRLAAMTDPAGRVTRYGYDLVGRLVETEQPGGDCDGPTVVGCVARSYNSAWELVGVDYSDPSTPDVSFGYDVLGRRTSMVDGTGSWSFVFDSIGRLLTEAGPAGTVTYGYADAGGQATSIDYPGTGTVTRVFDDAGRLVSTEGWAGGPAGYGYDHNSNHTSTDTGVSPGVEDSFDYDRVNRMTAATVRQDTTVLTSLGFGRDPEGMVTSRTASGVPGGADSFGYNNLDQLTSSTAGGYVFDLSDNPTGLGALGQRFGPANEVCYTAATATAPCGSPPGGATTFDYDGRGNRTATRPVGQAPTTMGYDQADRMTQATVPTRPDGGGQYHDLSTAEVWLATGDNLTAGSTRTWQITGTNGIPASGVESVLLRLHVANPAGYGGLVLYPTGTGPGAAVSMYLNPGAEASNLALAKVGVGGKVTLKATAATTLSVEVVGWYSNTPAAGGLTFEPVTAARAFSGTVTAGSTTPIQITGTGGVPASGVSAVAVVAHSLTNAPAGGLTLYSGPTAPATVTLLYDAGLGSALTVVPVDANGKINLYSSAANIPAVDVVGYYTPVETGGGNIAHTLDPAYLLDTSTPTGVCDPSPCARLVADTPVEVQVTGQGGVPAAGVTAVAVVVQTLAPDAAGVISLYATGEAAPGTATVLFDDAFTASMAIVPVGPDGTVTATSSTGTHLALQVVGYLEPAVGTYDYTYAGDGLRHSKTGPDGTVTTFVWDRNTPVPLLLGEQVDAPGTSEDRTVSYIHGPGGTVTADITTTPAGDEVRWYHRDHLGSTIALTGEDGGLLATYAYTPWGSVGTVTGTATTPIGWAGEYRDPETGYVYLRARYYNPTTAQFLTRDPAVALTRQPYAYAGNNPINYVDPLGLWPGFVDDAIDATGDAWDATGGRVVSASADLAQDAGDFVVRNRHTIIDVATTVGAAGVTGACVVSVACGVAVGAVGVAAVGVAGAGAHIASDRVIRDGSQISVGESLFRAGFSATAGAACGVLFTQGCAGSAAFPAGEGIFASGFASQGMSRLYPALVLADLSVLKHGLGQALFGPGC